MTAEKSKNTVVVKYTITGKGVMYLNTAIVLPEAATKVIRGENGGRLLKHVNIVTDLSVVEAKI